VYVKSVTLKGFKSFASATTLRLEPGITCIVGPNGSGKSNVVDALAWVMGEQGAKSLRGGKMEDVIFAGTSGRAPLGRAEVALTIDNTDGALPIDYSEVTISRTMFRNGGSDYAINGTTCRLLDVQELLSDSGIGREMHVIVGQGQLDAVLRATPEERRGFIEEAAGVLKHRKRKERALRKLETMEANLTRVKDLTTEIRRQLGPLGRQAETARKAGAIQAEVRDARLRLIADDLVQLTATLEQEVADETALIARRTEIEEQVGILSADLAELEARAEQARPQLAEAQDRWFILARLVERLSAIATFAGERVRLLAEDDDGPEAAPARDPQLLRAQAADLRDQHTALVDQIEQAAADLRAAVTARTAAEQEYAVEQQRLAALARAAADRREGLATLAGQVAARASRIEAREAEIGRLRDIEAASTARAAAAEREFATLEASIAVEEEGEEGLDTAYESAAADLARLQAEVARLVEAEREAERTRSAAAARADALAMSLSVKDGVASLLQGEDSRGVLGSLSQLVHVEPGSEAAIAAALGWAADAVAVESMADAVHHIARLRAADAGRAGLLVASGARPSDPAHWPALPAGARWAREVVRCDERIRSAVEHLLDRVALAGDAALAQAVVDSGLVAVTPDGDVLAPGFVRGGSGAPSQLEITAAMDEAKARADAAARESEQARFARAALTARADESAQQVAAALARLHDSDARMAAVAEQLGALGAAVRNARAEADRTQAAIRAGAEVLERDRTEHAELVTRLRAAEADTGDEADASTEHRDVLEQAARAARAHETEVRLTLRTREERDRALVERADALDAAAAAEEAARAAQAARRERRAREARTAHAVRAGSGYAVQLLRVSAARADEHRQVGERERAERDARMTVLRRELAVLQEQMRELTDSVHRDEVARAQQRLRIEALQARALDEYGVAFDTLVAEYGPDQPVPVVLTAPGPDHDRDHDPDAPAPDPVPYVRDVQERRLRTAERQLAALGRINPLALEEFAALEERHTFLTTQLEDLRTSKRDLLDIVREVDERVEQVFTEAFHDTAAQFEAVFSRLFPGGEGRLVLTDPANMLTTGLEVEARPPGKKIKRLSLLSGGERSLVAVALLVAIFKARPSPFYIMDEVEAALDDANLGRLLILFEELRDSSQLIVITHQKKTMEIADALYGVTMRGDGVTTVVSQRMRDLA
jgi:chromosome segregation protein